MHLIRPDWPAPTNIAAVFTTRLDGVSDPPYHSLNLSPNVDDDNEAVGENRMRLCAILPSAPNWLRQAHTSRVLRAEDIESDVSVADAAYTFSAGVPCAVITADCLPVLLCTRDGNGVAAAHAGWRGLAAGVLENTVAVLRANSDEPLIAYLGPAISAAHYEVGADVRDALCRDELDASHFYLHDATDEKWFANLPQLAARRLRDLGIEDITFSTACTYEDKKHYFSARRDNKTGRMAALVWKTALPKA
ncbi:peptidoglycan editing factor PgeF [Candidatus Persebacteraceae bacterium Df01]|jgi:YfiH family protein|uniref:Purine nucleoside phosphorylase n=1 Tax=Candidatus Doriopsillibacter californiensis TaxID=2970740 RepID=A0ABT7QKX8_9GAMM|nr:peptidoglycan editing factor PgeF [Candidatus Persebacteraceae bacterium Df01]